MLGFSHTNSSGVLFLRILGIAVLPFSWLTVFRPQMKVYWGRGTNRPLMSRKSRLAFAIAWTGWCLGVFGANQTLAVGLFLTGFVVAVISGKEDEKEHIARTDVPIRKAPTRQDYWLAFCFMDAILLSILAFSLVRDHFRPPVTEEHKNIHAMAVIFFVLLLVAAFALFLNRPEKSSTESLY